MSKNKHSEYLKAKALIKKGTSIREACYRSGISRTTFYCWDDPQFRAQAYASQRRTHRRARDAKKSIIMRFLGI